MEFSDRGVLILAGPTAGGKTNLAIAAAQRYGAEIVGADSRQVYRGMPIGTAAPTADQLLRAPHHLVGFLDPRERYSAARFAADAVEAIAAIHRRGKRAIVAGGTGFYLRALCGEVGLAAEPDPVVRERILHEARVHPPDVLHAWLTARNPQRAAAISAHDPYRIVRALEVALARPQTTAPLATPAQFATLRSERIPYRKVMLRVDPAELAGRIARRTDAMLAAGLLDEAERIGPDAVAADAVGYREALAYNCGWLTQAELRANLTRATRRYAKRQLTWLRSERDAVWLADDDRAGLDAVAAELGWRPIARG